MGIFSIICAGKRAKKRKKLQKCAKMCKKCAVFCKKVPKKALFAYFWRDTCAFDVMWTKRVWKQTHGARDLCPVTRMAKKDSRKKAKKLQKLFGWCCGELLLAPEAGK